MCFFADWRQWTRATNLEFFDWTVEVRQRRRHLFVANGLTPIQDLGHCLGEAYHHRDQTHEGKSSAYLPVVPP